MTSHAQTLAESPEALTVDGVREQVEALLPSLHPEVIADLADDLAGLSRLGWRHIEDEEKAALAAASTISAVGAAYVFTAHISHRDQRMAEVFEDRRLKLHEQFRARLRRKLPVHQRNTAVLVTGIERSPNGLKVIDGAQVLGAHVHGFVAFPAGAVSPDTQDELRGAVWAATGIKDRVTNFRAVQVKPWTNPNPVGWANYFVKESGTPRQIEGVDHIKLSVSATANARMLYEVVIQAWACEVDWHRMDAHIRPKS